MSFSKTSLIFPHKIHAIFWFQQLLSITWLSFKIQTNEKNILQVLFNRIQWRTQNVKKYEILEILTKVVISSYAIRNWL